MFRVLVVLLASAWSLPGLAADPVIAINPAQRTALRVTTVPVVSSAGAETVGLPARVSVPPAQERVIAAPVAGLITEVRASVGDRVRAGQALAVLRSEELMAAQRDIAQAAVQERLAADTARRDEALYTEGIVPESRVQAARAALAQARAKLRERRAWLRLMGMSAGAIGAAERGERLADSVTLAAPIAGVVLEQTAVAGARVDAASALFKVVQIDPLWLEVQAPADMAALVKVGQTVNVPGTRSTGKVVSIGSNVTAAQTVTIRARINNPDALLRLNQAVSAKIEGVAGARQWHVPVRGIVRYQGKNWVFVERPGGFAPTPVKVLSESAQMAAIDGPFSGAEKIAVEGVVALKAVWLGTGE